MDVLSDHDIRYIMTYTDELIFETEWHTSSAIACLQQCVSAKITRFAGQSYWNWITANGFEISDSWHPLEQAHAAAAELMMPAIDSILRKV